MRYLKKFDNLTFTDEDLAGLSKQIPQELLDKLHQLKNDDINVELAHLQHEMKKDNPNIEWMFSHVDLIIGYMEDLRMDNTLIDKLGGGLEDILYKYKNESEEKEFINDLPPEEGGPTYRDKDINELKSLVSKLPKMRWNISEDDGYFGDEWDNWEHMTENERFKYFGKMFSVVKQIKDKIEKL